MALSKTTYLYTISQHNLVKRVPWLILTYNPITVELEGGAEKKENIIG